MELTLDKVLAAVEGREDFRVKDQGFAVVLDNTVDDVLPLLPQQEREALQDFQVKFNRAFSYAIERVRWSISGSSTIGEDRKEFANRINRFLPKPLRSVAFRAYDGADVRETLEEVARKAIAGTEEKRTEFLEAIVGPRWGI